VCINLSIFALPLDSAVGERRERLERNQIGPTDFIGKRKKWKARAREELNIYENRVYLRSQDDVR
jgi:hypothetical protein